MKKTGFTHLFVLLLLGVVVLGLSLIVLTKKSTLPTPDIEEPVACTMDAKLCPDGSSVGRVGPRCEFSPCPSMEPEASMTNWKTFTSKKYNYSFKYPSDWYSFFYDENTSLAGTHTIYNYDTTHVQKYSNHGMIDYSKVDKSIEKIEITVLDGVEEDTSGLTESSDSLQIGNYPTQTFVQRKQTEAYFRELKTILPSGKTLLVVITTFNKSGDIKENDLSVVTKQILSTFRFHDSSTSGQKPTHELTLDLTKDISSTSYQIQSPLTIKGTIPAGYAFENSFPVNIEDQNKNIITSSTAQGTSGDWTNGKPLGFTVTFTFKTTAKAGFLVFKNDNPSGLPQNEKKIIVPVQFSN